MRTAVVTLGLSLVIPAALAAQASSPRAPEVLTITPAAPVRPSLDFGLDQAKQKLNEGPWRLVTAKPTHSITQLPFQPTLPASVVIEGQPAIDCAMVKKHNHGPASMRVIPPPTNVEHKLKTTPVPPCPVR